MLTAAPPSDMSRVTYHPYGGARDLMKCKGAEVLLEGPAGTGKSYACLWKMHSLALKYPGMRGLMVRKTLLSLTSTAVVTYRNRVLASGNFGVKFFGGSRDRPAGFQYPNGSELLLGGMDKPDKIMSSEYDIAFVNEATELTLEDWEKITTRLRNGMIPYQQLIADCNPQMPTHWLNQRANEGKVTRLHSWHEDNPRYWRHKTKDWTSEGRLYMSKLDALTGVRYQRLRLGKWVAAEGQVYETFDPNETHLLSFDQLVNAGILLPDGSINRQVVVDVIAGVDWGYTNPGVILVVAIDRDGRMYVVYEVYRARKIIDWWIREARILQDRFGIRLFTCDPSEPGYIEQFNRAGLLAEKAKNDILPGIGAVMARLAVAGDGRARIFLYRDALQAEDEELRDASRPYRTADEFLSYIWATPKANARAPKELPVDDNNHGLDALRYAVAYKDLDAQGGFDALRDYQRRQLGA